MRIDQPSHELKQAALHVIRDGIGKGFVYETLYQYCAIDGQPVFWRIRAKHPHSKKKWIRLMTPTETGYQAKGPVCPDGTPLYRLPDLAMQATSPDSVAGAAPVFVTEGEPKVEALIELGLCATTSGAADSANKADWRILAGREVRIWPDNDDAGLRYADAVGKILHGLGCSVTIIDTDKLDLPAKGDVVDWLQVNPRADSAAILALPHRPYVPRIAPADLKKPQSVSMAWPDLQPIDAPLKPVPAFDAATLLPDALRDWVMDEADRMHCAPDFIAVTVMTSIGAIVGARCAMRPKAFDNWMVVPNLWGGVVGDPSSMKSPAMGIGMKPLGRLITRANQAYKADSQAFCIEKEKMAFKEDAILSRMKNAAKAKEGKGEDIDAIGEELKAHRQEAEAEPVLKRYKTNDTTVEKLGELLRDNPAGILVQRDELVGLISAWDKEGREGERAFYLEGWNGNASFDTDRIGRGAIFIENLCLSVFGGIQPDKLTLYLEQASSGLSNDGMLQRFQMLVYPERMPWAYSDRGPDVNLSKRVNTIFDALAEFEPVTWGAMPASEIAKFPFFYFDPAAQAIFIEWLTDMHCQRLPNEEEPMIEQHLSKFDKLFPALALLLHLIQCAATGERGPVTAQAALRAAAWCEYLEAHARRCYGLLLDDGLRSAQALAAKLEAGKLQDHFTARDVRRNRWRYLSTDDAVMAALDWLEDEGWLLGQEIGGDGPGTGRRTVRYVINPKISTMARTEAAAPAFETDAPEGEDGE